jgi:hypothetical protein
VKGKKRAIKVPVVLEPEIERGLALRARWSHRLAVAARPARTMRQDCHTLTHPSINSDLC